MDLKYLRELFIGWKILVYGFRVFRLWLLGCGFGFIVRLFVMEVRVEDLEGSRVEFLWFSCFWEIFIGIIRGVIGI